MVRRDNRVKPLKPKDMPLDEMRVMVQKLVNVVLAKLVDGGLIDHDTRQEWLDRRATRHTAPCAQQGAYERVSTTHAVDSSHKSTKPHYVPVVKVKREKGTRDTRIVITCEIHKQGPISDAEKEFLTTVGNIGVTCACYNVSTGIGMRAMAFQAASAH